MKKYLVMAMIMGWVTSSYAVRLGEGTQALDLSGNADFTSSSQQLKMGYGYFIRDYLEVGGLFDIAHNEQLTVFAFGPRAEYNFDLDRMPVVPFVGSALLFQHGKVTVDSVVINSGSGLPEAVTASDTHDALSLTVYGGAKFFITDAFAISADLALSAATSDVYPKKNGDVGNTDARIELGLRYYF